MILEAEALLWTNGRTADQLSAIPNGKITVSQCRQMIDLSTSVVRCLLPSPDDPSALLFPSLQLAPMMLVKAEAVLARDVGRIQMMEHKSPGTDAFKDHNWNQSFLNTFASPREVSPTNGRVPFIRVSLFSSLCEAIAGIKAEITPNSSCSI